MPKTMTRALVISRSKEKHPGKFGYGKMVYNGYYGELKLLCKSCRVYFTTSLGAHLKGKGGCKLCAAKSGSDSRISMTTREFVKRSKAIHGKRYRYEKTKFTGTERNVILFCTECDSEFEQVARLNLNGCGCVSCSGSKGSSIARFVQKAVAKHGHLYDYSEVEYLGVRTKVKIGCRECEKVFTQIPNSHLNGSGCPHCCRPHAHSKSAIRWLEHEAKKRRIKIQHAQNGGEFSIPGTRFRADGYHKKSKTIFEFYGDIYHGNLNVYRPRSRPNPYSTDTAATLHRKTMEREELLRSMGYKVVSIWQSDFRALLKAGKI